MSTPKSELHIYIPIILCVLFAIIFSSLFVRLELKLVHFEERLKEFQKDKESCCAKGEAEKLSFQNLFSTLDSDVADCGKQ